MADEWSSQGNQNIWGTVPHVMEMQSEGGAVVGTVMAAMLKLEWGVVPAYLCERFPTSRRAAGVGFG
jgi:hypothetical protein